MVIHACKVASFGLYRRYKGRPFELPLRLFSILINCLATDVVESIYFLVLTLSILRLLAMDVSALVSMKDAACCETQCDVQNSEIH
jgi:hypothetical protein